MTTTYQFEVSFVDATGQRDWEIVRASGKQEAIDKISEKHGHITNASASRIAN